jgi:hypothetical protein
LRERERERERESIPRKEAAMRRAKRRDELQPSPSSPSLLTTIAVGSNLRFCDLFAQFSPEHRFLVKRRFGGNGKERMKTGDERAA